MKTIKINLNDNIKIKLTEEGRKILLDEYMRYSKPFKSEEERIKRKIEMIKHSIQPYMDDEGYFTTQLHNLMSVFGTHMNVGFNQLIADNNIFYTRKA